MPLDLTRLLRDRPSPLILDGGMGSQLIARGLVQGRPPEGWNVEHPERVAAVHAVYLAAGSELIQTNTFGGNPVVLASHGLADRMEELNLAGARIAREAADQAASADGRRRLVAGNIGPSGTMLPPVGSADPEALREAFARQAAALEAGGVDSISIETMTDLREALCALGGALESTRLQVTVCLTFDRKKRGFFTLMGDRMEEAVRQLADSGAGAVGANCSVGSDVLLEAAPLLAGASSLPVLLKPNAGLPEVTPSGLTYRQQPEEFATDMVAAARCGVAAIGGCCGTDERFIAALVAGLGREAEG